MACYACEKDRLCDECVAEQERIMDALVKAKAKKGKVK